MKAAVLRQLGRFEIEDVALDGPRGEELRVRVLASGLCHSDWHFVTGHMPAVMPAVLGHEIAGEVIAVGKDVRGFAVGDRIISCFSAWCGTCPQCQGGHGHRCDDKPGAPVDRPAGSRITGAGNEAIYQMGNLGGFAEEVVIHARAAVKMPAGMPPASAALMGCGVLTGCGAVMHAAKVAPGSTVAVIGCGGVGLNAVQAARICGARRIIAIDTNPAKLELARRFGATDAVIGGPDAVGAVMELTRGGVDHAFEVVGHPATAQQAFAMLGKGGTAVLVGVAATGAEVSLPMNLLTMGERRVIGSMMGSTPFRTFLPQLAELYARGTLLLDELVTRRIALEEINEGYAAMVAGTVARSVITFG